MKRDFREIELIMAKINGKDNSNSLAGFKTPVGWWEKWNNTSVKEIASVCGAETLPPNFIVKRTKRGFDIPESKLSDVKFAEHFKHDLRLNVLGVICKTCKLVIEGNN